MRFSRHAKNEMRLYGIRRGDVEKVVANPIATQFDRSGNRRLTGLGMDRRAIIVVLAGDEPSFVITTFPDD
ncbi:MAG TPA: DUF4258 domain-containing protein [Solirubrobacterales bacterium]|nr:DUF4258 domain-containing protein [Solirubrobacterales bacterium]